MWSTDIKLEFDEVQNIMIEREKNVKMEMGKVVRGRDWLKKEVDLLEKLEKCSLEEKLGRSERRCEELDKRAVRMEEEIEKLRREKFDVEEKLGKSERRREELDKRIVEMVEKIEKLRHKKLNVEEKLERSHRKCGELKRKEMVVEELQHENNELRVKKMEPHKAAQLYKTRMLKVGAKLANSGGSGGIGLSKKGGRKSAYNSGIAGSKGTVKDDQGKKPEVRGASYRASTSSRCALGIINKIRNNLHKENLEIFEQSCFGHLLKINKLTFQGQLMLQLLLHMDMVVSNKERLVFKINNSNIEFGPSDFDLITGLLFGTSEAITTSSLSSIHKDVFQGRSCIQLNDVKKAFLTASRDNEGRGELTLKLALVYFLYGILLPRNGRINKSDMQYLPLIEDLQKFNAFPWGRVAYQFLVESILLVRGRMDGLTVTHKSANFDIHGFSFALQTWAYEMMPSVATYCASRANNFDNLTPRILCWSATKFFCFNRLKIFFTPGDKTHLVLRGIQTSPDKKITMVKCATPLSRLQPKKRKLVCDKDQMSSAGPTYPMHHPGRNILRMELDELRVEKMKSDEHYRKRLEDLEARLEERAASADAEEEKNVNFADGKAQYGDTMSAEVRATCEHSAGSGGHGLSNKGSHASVTRSDGEVPTGKIARPSSAAGDVIAISDSDDEIPDMPFRLTNKRNVAEYCREDYPVNWTARKKRSKSTRVAAAAADCDSESPLQNFNAANDVDSTDSSDDESCSDAYMSNLVAMLQSKKEQRMDV